MWETPFLGAASDEVFIDSSCWFSPFIGLPENPQAQGFPFLLWLSVCLSGDECESGEGLQCGVMSSELTLQEGRGFQRVLLLCSHPEVCLVAAVAEVLGDTEALGISLYF